MIERDINERLTALITLLQSTSLYDIDLEIQKQKYLSYVESVYKKPNNPIMVKKPSLVYDEEREILSKGGNKMKKKINDYKKEKLTLESEELKTPMRFRAVSSFGLHIEEPEIESVYSDTRPVSPQIKIPVDIEKQNWKIDKESAIDILMISFELIEAHITKTNCMRLYANSSIKEQGQFCFATVIQSRQLDQKTSILFSDGLLHYCVQFSEIIPKDWLDSRNKSKNVYSSMHPIHQQVIQMIQSHLSNIGDRFPSQSSRITKSFAKCLTTNESDLNFLKEWFMDSK